MTTNEIFALLAVLTALRVFFPDARTGMRRLLRAGARVGLAELLVNQTARPATAETRTADTARDGEAER